MTASELSRFLLYCGFNDVTDYLMNSPVNRFLYKRFLEILPASQIDTPVVDIFNEVYYQCARIRFDNHPGVDVEKRYLEECSDWLKSFAASELVFSLVLAFLERKHKLSFHEECYKQSLRPLLDGCVFLGLAKDLVHFMEQNIIFSPNEFETMPWPINDLPKEKDLDFLYEELAGNIIFKKLIRLIAIPEKKKEKVNPWAEVTDNYTFSVMESYVKLYRIKEDQMALLKRLVDSCSDFERASNQADFNKLESRISAGEYLCKKIEYEPVCDTQEEYDRMFAAGYNQTMEQAQISKEEQYRQERDTYKYQLEQLKKNYEADLESIEAKYQDEIAALKKDLDKKAAAKQKDETDKDTAPEELYMTIDEIVSDAKEWFHESGASELTNMLYRYIRKHNYYDKNELWDLIESIIPAVEKRTTPLQKVDVSQAGQVNIGSQTVNNHLKEEK